MQVSIRLFASARESAGTSVAVIDLPSTATVADLAPALAKAFPGLERIAHIARFAVNHEYATADQPLTARDEIAMLPPVSGGGEVG